MDIERQNFLNECKGPQQTLEQFKEAVGNALMAKFGITINDCTDDQQIEREFKDFSTVDSFVDWLGDKYDLTPIR